LASQKEKFLNSAQKYLQKGQVERAIKDYEQVVAADPEDIRQRQKLAELLARCGRNEKAVEEYEKIASHYVDNGFYLKAMAVYKQIQKIDTGNIEISLTLATLNEKQGLIGNALSEYKVVFDHYERAGLSQDACEILKKMHDVDPENIDIALKLAETLFAAGRVDDAYQRYTRAALLLKNRSNDSLFDKVSARIETLFPDKKEFIVDILGEQIKAGMVSDVIPKLEQILETDEQNGKVLSLLAEAYKATGDMEGTIHAWSRKLHHFPSEADAKEGVVQCIIEQGDFDESFKVLELYAPDLISAGLFASVERFYTTLQSQAPYETRILEGLKTLYEASGEQAKLADIQVSLNILSGNVTGETSATPETHAASSEVNTGVTGLPGVNEIEFAVEGEVDPVLQGVESDLSSTGDGYAGYAASEEDPVRQERSSGEFEIELEPYTLSLEDLELTLELPDGSEITRFSETAEIPYEDPPAGQSAEEAADEQQAPVALNLDLDETFVDFEIEEEPIGEGAEKESAPVELVLEEVTGESGADWLEIDLSEEIETDEDRNEHPGLTSDDVADIGVGNQASVDELAGIATDSDQHFEREDTETHFNLGIAYKEMGLYDDAMKEFAAAAIDPLRTVDCVILRGICLKEKGELEKAEEVFTSGIRLFEREPEKSLNLKFELALLHEAAGRNEDALRVYREVFTLNPGFRDTVAKIAKLQGNTGMLDLSDIDEMDFDLEGIKSKW
jgi:tetratricopeptide (TPR) repeat protein